MPELIADGSSGLLVAPDNLEAAVAAVAQAQQLDRQAVRAHVERHFTAQRMVDDYLNLYNRLLGHALMTHLDRVARGPRVDGVTPVTSARRTCIRAETAC